MFESQSGASEALEKHIHFKALLTQTSVTSMAPSRGILSGGFSLNRISQSKV